MIITGKKFSKPAMSRVINGDVELVGEPEKPEKVRLDHILMQLHPEFNRSSLQKFIREGRVTVGGEVVLKPNTGISPEAKVEIEIPEELVDSSARQKDIEAARPETIYEDQNVLVVNKPAGLLSMTKGEVCTEPTLEDYGLLVHRLDRDTSGVVILAKNEATQSMLRREFQERTAHKTYVAVVSGQPKLDKAKINLPIARNNKRPNTFMVSPNGRPSETYYEVTSSTGAHSLVKLKPTTGRTHQLRVHLAYLGAPILGDRVYNEKDPADRLYLHALELEVTIPDPEVEYSGKSSEDRPNIRKTFKAPMPEEFKRAVEDE